MGISRSASTVMAFLMKDRRWSVEEAYDFVKERRSCVHPNAGFMEQLRMYEAILTASNKRDIFRCKSDQNLLDDGTKEEVETTQGSFLGDSLFHMMSHSDWPNASGGVAHEEEWIQSLDSEQGLASNMMQVDTDLEAAESRSADSMEEALPDIPSPPPYETQAAGNTTMPITPPGAQSCFPPLPSDMEIKDPGSESEYFTTRCSSESSDRVNSSLLLTCPSSLNPRIKPDSSWIRLDSLETSSERDDNLKASENDTENLPFIDALSGDDVCNNTQASGSSSASAATSNEVVVSQSDTAKPFQSATELKRAPFGTASMPSTTHPHSFNNPLQSSHSGPSRPSAMGDGRGAQFYVGSLDQPPESAQNVPVIVVNADTYVNQSTSLPSAMFNQSSGDFRLNRNPETRAAMEPVRQDQSMNNEIGDTSQLPTQGSQNIKACEKTQGDPDKDTEKEGKSDADKPCHKGLPAKIELGVRQYFFREKIPWSPGKVKKIREDINKTGQISKDEEEEDETEEKCAGESPSDHEMNEDQALLDLMTEQQPPSILSQSRSCMELFTPGEGDSGPISLYEKEEIPLEPGTVLRTRLEIEERQRLFCGEGDQEGFASSRPVLRTSSLKQERESPRSRRSDKRRLTCGPIMSPVGGKSLDDLRSVGTSEGNLFDPEPLLSDRSDVKDTVMHMNSAHVTSSRPTITTTSQCSTNVTSPQKVSSEDLLAKTFPYETRTDDGKQLEDTSATPMNWRQERVQGNFDAETLALIREIGSALLMSPTPPKAKDTTEEEPCSNMVKYFVRKIEKQTKSQQDRNIILTDNGSKENVQGHSDVRDLHEAGLVDENVGRKYGDQSSGSHSLDHVDTWRDRNIGRMQESTVLPNKHLLKDETDGPDFFRQGQNLKGVSLTGTTDKEDSKHNNVPTSLSLSKRTQPMGSATENGMQQSGGMEENGNNTSHPHCGSASTPRTPSHPGGSDSGEASVVRHLLGKFEIQSPKTERLPSDFGHDYTHKLKDSEGHLLSSPISPQKDYSHFSSTDGTAPQPIGTPSSLSCCRSVDSQLSPQFSSPAISHSFDPSASFKSSSSSLSSSSFTSSSFVPPSHRRQTSLDSFQLSPSAKPKRSPLECDIAVELYELPSQGNTTPIGGSGNSSTVVSFESCAGTSKQGPTPFSKHSMEISPSKSWRSVRPKSADQVQRLPSASNCDSESSDIMSDFHSGRKTRDRYSVLGERSLTFDEDIDTNLRQVSEEGRKIRRLHGKSHPLTKLSEKQLGKGPFYSSM